MKTYLCRNILSPLQVIYCLGGLTSTEDNFAQKGGAASRASKYEIALVFPDTSPRKSS